MKLIAAFYALLFIGFSQPSSALPQSSSMVFGQPARWLFDLLMQGNGSKIIEGSFVDEGKTFGVTDVSIGDDLVSCHSQGKTANSPKSSADPADLFCSIRADHIETLFGDTNDIRFQEATAQALYEALPIPEVAISGGRTLTKVLGTPGKSGVACNKFVTTPEVYLCAVAW